MFKKFGLYGAAALLAFSGAAIAQDGAMGDAEIAHIAYTAGALDVAAGQQALTKSKNAEVRAFAESMVRDHAAVNDQALALVKKLGVTPAANGTSAALSKQAGDTLASLAKLDGAAYDAAYIKNEVAFHQTVNSALAGALIPGAKNAELKSLLETGLTLFKEHQAHAEMVAAKLQ